MITGDQLLLHAIGDYVIQSDWMALQKTKQHRAAAAHSFTYSAPFLLLQPSITAWIVIFVTHFLIDRYRLARYVVWVKNFSSPLGSNPPWLECTTTGYPSDRPAWMAVWLMIAADNCIHVLINGLAMRYL